jgi:beta-galactosidase
VVVEPAFYWYFGEGCSVAELPEAMVCSNCEELRVFLGSREAARLYPDRQRFPDLERPPFFLPVARFSSAGAVPSDLTIEGYVEGRLVARRSFSADVTFDRLDLAPDDRQIDADGADLTRVVVRVSDRYGWTRPRASGIVELDLEGPGEIIGESRFSLDDAGPVRALWLRGRPGQAGRIWLFASHSRYPRAGVSVQVC